MTEHESAFPNHGIPDIKISVRQVFGIDTDLQAPGFSEAEDHVPDMDEAYPRVSLEVRAERAPDLILDTFLDPAGGAQAEAEVRRYWQRFGWVRRVEPLPPGVATLPAPNLTEGARLLRARIHPEVQLP